MQPFISIIIPTIRANDILEQCLDSLAKQDYPKNKFEIILVSKEKLSLDPGSSIKTIFGIEFVHARNKGVEASRGELIAFVDDDCVIPRDWISKAVKYFQDDQVAVIGGAALPLKEDVFHYRVGGYLLASSFTSGFASSRYKVLNKVYEAEEYSLIAANNMLRRDVFNSISGFNPEQALSEENDLYFRLKEKGYKLLYVPEIFVWHRAKPIWMPILRNVFFYATGRGVLMGRKPRSIRIVYLVPTMFAFGVVASPVLLSFVPAFLPLFVPVAVVYGLLNSANAVSVLWKNEKNPLVVIAMFVMTPFLHFAYGVGILYGLYLFVRGDIGSGRKLWSKD